MPQDEFARDPGSVAKDLLPGGVFVNREVHGTEVFRCDQAPQVLEVLNMTVESRRGYA